MNKDLKTLARWVIIAFLIGMALQAGTTTTKHLWPEPPGRVEHVVVPEDCGGPCG